MNKIRMLLMLSFLSACTEHPNSAHEAWLHRVNLEHAYLEITRSIPVKAEAHSVWLDAGGVTPRGIDVWDHACRLSLKRLRPAPYLIEQGRYVITEVRAFDRYVDESTVELSTELKLESEQGGDITHLKCQRWVDRLGLLPMGYYISLDEFEQTTGHSLRLVEKPQAQKNRP